MIIITLILYLLSCSVNLMKDYAIFYSRSLIAILFCLCFTCYEILCSYNLNNSIYSDWAKSIVLYGTLRVIISVFKSIILLFILIPSESLNFLLIPSINFFLRCVYD